MSDRYHISDKPDRIRDTVYTLIPVYPFFTLFSLFSQFLVDKWIRWVYSVVVTVINPSNWSRNHDELLRCFPQIKQ